MFIQHYEYRPAGDAAPVIRLDNSDAPWYDRFAAEARQMWHDGTHWQPASDTTSNPT